MAEFDGERTILYLDDEEPLVFIMKRMLERLGHRSRAFTNADAALAEFERRARELSARAVRHVDAGHERYRFRDRRAESEARNARGDRLPAT